MSIMTSPELQRHIHVLRCKLGDTAVRGTVGHVIGDLYRGSRSLPSNSWLMVCGSVESRPHQVPWIWRLPHYLGPFTAALWKFYSQIRWNKVVSKKIIFGVWSSGSRRPAWGSYAALRGGGEWRLNSRAVCSDFLPRAGFPEEVT